MEEIKEANQDTSVRIEYELDEFLHLIRWYQMALQHIADTQPEGLYRIKDGKMAVPSAIIEVLQQALEMDKAGDIDLSSVE